jgi:predicted anti-sigma-YlaC factor YlaD
VIVSARPRRAAGVLAVLGTFVAVLGLLSIRDLAGGFVTVDRLATHLGAVAGVVFVAALARVERALPPERPSIEVGDDREDQSRLRGVA